LVSIIKLIIGGQDAGGYGIPTYNFYFHETLSSTLKLLLNLIPFHNLRYCKYFIYHLLLWTKISDFNVITNS